MMVLKNDRLHKMETGWNNRVSEEPQGKFVRHRDREEIMDLFLQQQGKIPIPDIMPVASAHPRARTSSKRGDGPKSANKRPNQRGVGGNSNGGADNDGEPSSAYTSITRAFEFEHHKGTDRNLELRVLKLILKRENALLEIQTECQSIRAIAPVLRNSKKTGILDLMCGIRDLTIEITEATTLWRKSMVSYDPSMPRPFMWQQQNYLLKIVEDLNFLSLVDPLVEVLRLPAQKLIRNPLMLPDTLDESAEHADITPEARSEADLDGDTSGPQFAERLRIRRAEEVLLKEIEFNKLGDPSIAWSDYNPSIYQGDRSIIESVSLDQPSSFIEDTTKGRRRSYVTGKGSPIIIDPSDAKRLEALADWHEQAGTQLQRIYSSVGEHLHSASTERMKIPSPGAAYAAKYAFRPMELVEPSLLTNLRSSNSEIRAVSAANVRSSSPYLKPGVNTDNSSPSSRDQPKSVSKGLQKAPSSLDAWHSTFDPDEQQKNKNQRPSSSQNATGSRGVREIKRLPGSQTDGESLFGHDYSTNIDAGVINSLLSITDAPKVARLAAASILILLSSSDDIPEDLSWESFLSFAKTQDVSTLMKSLIPRDVPKFKIRSVLPFLSQMDVSSLSSDESLPEYAGESLSRIVSWLKEVMYYDDASYTQKKNQKNDRYAIRVEEADRNAELRQSPAVTPSNRKSRGIKAKRFNPFIKLSTDTSAGGSTEAFALQKRNPAPVPTNLKVVYSELVPDIFVRPLVLSLLVKNTEFTEPSPISASVKAYNQGKHAPVNFTIKLYDPSAEQSAETSINVKEFMNHQQDLRVKLNNSKEVSQLYQPHKVGWWIENLKSLVIVSIKPQGELVIRVSKSKIARMIARHIGIYYQLDSESIDATTVGVDSPQVQKSNNDSVSHQPQSAPSASKKEHTRSAPALASLYQRPVVKRPEPHASNPPSAQSTVRASVKPLSATKRSDETASLSCTDAKENGPTATSRKSSNKSGTSDAKIANSSSKSSFDLEVSEDKNRTPVVASRSSSIGAEEKISRAESKFSSKESFDAPKQAPNDSVVGIVSDVSRGPEAVASDAKSLVVPQNQSTDNRDVVSPSAGFSSVISRNDSTSDTVAKTSTVDSVQRSGSKSAPFESTVQSEDYGNEYEEDEFEATSPLKLPAPKADDTTNPTVGATNDEKISIDESMKAGDDAKLESSNYLLNLALLDEETVQPDGAEVEAKQAAAAEEDNEYGDEDFDFS